MILIIILDGGSLRLAAAKVVKEYKPENGRG
jgi:hypothetical protein